MAAKEMLILFVYDLEHCKSEHDDPLDAIKYFHPSWVSDIQKLFLCGQIISARNFCCEFSDPEVISLENGKFKVEKFGRFVLAMGTDRNIQESLLIHRAELMVNILRLYHQDIETIFKQFDESKNFSDKLYHIFETYLPVLQYNGGNLLQNVYKLFLPKSASNLYLDAMQILENLACRPGVLGGCILHHNKVLASQFSADLTKILTATDPFRIKTTAEAEKNTNFHIPVGASILKVYVKVNEYNRLQKHIRKVSEATNFGIQNSQPLPFSIKKKSKEIKREKSLIFSNIPEEEALVEMPVRNRPNHLPLKFKTAATKDLPESGIASIMSFDETDSFADFIGRTSVCATPMTENAILSLIGPMQSIFAPPEAQPETDAEEISDEKKPRVLEPILIQFESHPHMDFKWKKSFADITKDFLDDESSDMRVYNTITDPLFPIFTHKRQPLSKSLFENQNLTVIDNEFFQPPKPYQPKQEPEEPPKEKIEEPVVKKPQPTLPVDNKNSPSKALRNQKKKMMRLPIKSFSLEMDSGKPSTSTSSSTMFDSPSTKTKKYMGSLQLTPLMSKLTLLAMSENENYSSGFSSIDLPTPTPVDNPSSKTLFNRLSKVEEEMTEDAPETDEMKRVNLFVCGQQNMTLMVIGDEETDQQILQTLFEICVNRLNRLEQKLNEIINVTVDLKASDYSFISLDKSWDVLKRGGAWQHNDLQSLLLMHDSFASNKNISDIVVRTNDSVLYGHGTGGSEVYYQQPSQKQSNGGLPAPSDFTVITQAKRRLERDHSLVLF